MLETNGFVMTRFLGGRNISVKYYFIVVCVKIVFVACSSRIARFETQFFTVSPWSNIFFTFLEDHTFIMVTQGANVRKGVLVVSTIVLTLQIVGFFLTIIFFLYAGKEAYRNRLSRAIFTTLYEQKHWNWLRRENSLEVNNLIKYPIQAFLQHGQGRYFSQPH